MFLDDGTPGGAPIVSAVPSPQALTVLGDYVYWTNYGNFETDGRVMGSDIQGAGAGDIAVDQSDPRGIAASASHIYWTNYFDGTIWRAKRDGTEVEQLLSALSSPSDIAVDALGVYWVEMGTPDAFQDGKVMGARLDGSEITPIATGQHAPRRIEVDADAVYWLNRGTTGLSAGCSQHDGAVMRATRPW
jgi:DNA-binding beta-propeller fold protein YncE